MIVHISGVLIKKDINQLVIESKGLGYECFISDNTFNQLPNIGDSITLLTFLHITENKHTLYGFHSESERDLLIPQIVFFSSDVEYTKFPVIITKACR